MQNDLTPEQVEALKKLSEVKPPSVPPVPVVENVENAVMKEPVVTASKTNIMEHIKKIRSNMDNYKGKAGMNSFKWLKDNKIDELEKAFLAGDGAAGLKLLQIPVDAVPTI